MNWGMTYCYCFISSVDTVIILPQLNLTNLTFSQCHYLTIFFCLNLITLSGCHLLSIDDMCASGAITSIRAFPKSYGEHTNMIYFSGRSSDLCSRTSLNYQSKNFDKYEKKSLSQIRL
jgi:hypothetical protein